MKAYLVVTVTCPDRPGIVDRVTEVLMPHGANWEESRMARLGGEFAGIALISVDDAKVGDVTRALEQLADEQMSVTVKRTGMSEAERAGKYLFELHLVGADHEGIVHRVTHFLAEQGVNVESMSTDVAPAPVSASPLFEMHARVQVPAGISLADLSSNLVKIGDELGVDIELKAVGD